jgi:predicted Fe-S protein YdhL (DUF1289 family)
MEGGICIGCLRTLAEIVNWRGMDRESRLKVMKDLEFRKIMSLNSATGRSNRRSDPSAGPCGPNEKGFE